jgi:predicted dinucleotide-binding enzyme
MQVAIIGTGQMAQGLASVALSSGGSFNYKITLGTRHHTTMQLHGMDVREIEEAIASAHIVILAVPTVALPGLVSDLGRLFQGKVVVDVTNPTAADLAKLSSLEFGGDITSVAEWLQLQLDGVSVVKAFNNLAASRLQQAGPNTTLHTVAASDSPEALAQVAALASACGIQVRQVPSISYSRTLELEQRKVALDDWVGPATVMVLVFFAAYLYCSVKKHGQSSSLVSISVQTTNSALAWQAITGTAVVYLPGALARAFQCVSMTKQPMLPLWMRRWFQWRKQLGVLSTAAAALHILVCSRMNLMCMFFLF